MNSSASRRQRARTGTRRATRPMRGSSPSWACPWWSCWRRAGRAHPRPRLRRRRADRCGWPSSAARWSASTPAPTWFARRARPRRRRSARGWSGPAVRARVRRRLLQRCPALDEADPDAVIAGVARALRPGGRFVGEFGGHGNVAAITVALAGGAGAPRHRRRRADPVVLPDAGRISQRLERHGFDGRPDRADPAADAVADRHGGLARDLRRSVPAHRYPTPSGPRLRAEAVELLRPVLRDHVAAGGRPTMCACVSRQFCNYRGKLTSAEQFAQCLTSYAVIGPLFTSPADHTTVPRPSWIVGAATGNRPTLAARSDHPPQRDRGSSSDR